MQNKDYKTDVLLIQCPPWSAEFPSLGLAYLSETLKKSGFAVKVLDINLKLYNMVSNDVKKFWDFEKKDDWIIENLYKNIKSKIDDIFMFLIERIRLLNPYIIGLSVNQNSILFARDLAENIKKILNSKLIAGGSGCYNKHERDFLKTGDFFDAYVIGEGENTLKELADYIIKKKGLKENIAGVIWKNEDKFQKRQYIKDLDTIPFPTYDEFDLSDYTSNPAVLPLLFSRGCIGNCTFCNDRIYMGYFRNKKPTDMVKEIEFHINKNKINNFNFNDLAINCNLNILKEFCEEIISKKIKINWVAQAIPRKGMDKNIFSKMKQAGCGVLQFGIESGSDKVLKLMKKMVTVKDSENALKYSKKSGIQNWVNIIVGYPGETEDDFKKTYDFLKRNRKYIDRISSVNTCNVVFNSDLMVNRKKYGIILPDSLEFIEVKWKTLDGNCDEFRKKQAKKIYALIKDMEIPVGQSNIFLKNI